MEGLFTGDHGRLCGDSEIYFTGRKEDYFKKNGKRFTMGEMESAVEKALTTLRHHRPSGELSATSLGTSVAVRCVEVNGEFHAFITGIDDEDMGRFSVTDSLILAWHFINFPLDHCVIMITVPRGLWHTK